MNTKLSKTHQYTGREVADALGVHPSTLCRWLQTIEGFPQPLRVSRLVQLHDLKAVRAFLAERSKQLQGA